MPAPASVPELFRLIGKSGLLEPAELEPYARTAAALAQDPAEAAAGWAGPIRLLFIDGDHSYEASRRDFELWSPHVVPHGLVCFHDIPSWPGVTQFYQELTGSTAEYQEVCAAVSLRVLERRPPGRG